ncbi:MAG: DUF742 domain-containing protein [Actinomycetota bacterium]
MTHDDRADGLAARIRPYALTGGRTRGNQDLPLETIVRTTPQGRAVQPRLVREQATIVDLCADPQSLAEISAHLTVPLGVVRVIVGDLAAEGLVASSGTATTANPSQDRPDIKLLERVLDGLQAL